MVPLFLSKVSITWIKQIKYLGFTFTSNLSFKSHIDASLFNATRASGALRHLLCSKSKIDSRTKVKVYKFYIRPILTYAEPLLLWAP